MPTRAAEKREAALLKESLAAVALSSTLDTKSANGAISIVSPSAGGKESVGEGKNSGGNPDMQLPTPLAGAKRKRGPAKKKVVESVKGEWDVLPHGLGRKGDLLEDTTIKPQGLGETLVLTPQKRARRGKNTTGNNDGSMADSSVRVKVEDQIHAKGIPKEEQTGTSEKPDPVTVELLEETLPKKCGRRAKSVKTEEDGADAKEDFEEKPKKRAPRKKKALDVSGDVLDKINDLLNASGQIPKKEPKKKANKYGLTPGKSPFPDYVKPTPEDCEEVNSLLSALHGEVKVPEVIPPPSMEVTGCGEVPDLLDAILRTLLSASTTANNANLSLKGLKDKFNLRESGVGKGSINWEAVHKADLDTVIDAIKSGGLAKLKGTNIKKILDAVYEQNCIRRDALLKEKETGNPANIPGAKHETQEQKDAEIAKANENMLSMDHLFEMTTEEAMEEMTKLPGIGVKTASCVVLFCMKRPSFAVDTHVWRHCKWLGWVPATATRDQTFSHCEVRVPDHLKYSLHQLFLKHGKTCGRCRANTSAGTEEWNNTNCPIDHLVNRTEKRKMAGNSSVGKAKPHNGKKGGKKGKKTDNETEESDVAMDNETDESGFEGDV